MYNPASTVAGETSQLHNDLGAVRDNSTTFSNLTEKDRHSNTVQPKSGINFVLYNNKFDVVEENTGYLPVDDHINAIQNLATDKLVMKEAGFIEIFVNNDAQTPVYYDNLMVTMTTGYVMEINAYYPSGKLLSNFSTNNWLYAPQYNHYKFQSKEEIKELQLNWLDFHWRQYDPVIGRATSPDPHAENYYHLSPYSMFANNPIRYIDPDGRDIWEVDEWGHVNWIEKSKKHTLYSVDAEGNRGNSITLKRRDVFDKLAENKKTADGKNDMRLAKGGENTQNDMAQTFLFMADNTKVEWRMDRYSYNGENSYALGTKHSEIQTIGTDDMGFSPENSIAWIHNHPGTSKIGMAAERSEMGWTVNKNGTVSWDGDSRTKYNTYPNAYYYTYFPQSGRLYSVEGNRQPSFIRNVNSNYKRLFFGTLNTR